MPAVRRSTALVAVLAFALAIGACGSDDETTAESNDHSAMGHGSGTETKGPAVDRAFAAAMIPHHESAIEMAEIAQDRGESDFVKQLAHDIVTTQQSEIDTLKRIDGELETEGIKPGDLGVPTHMQGMDDDPEELRDADPFDREFVDMMIPHHQGAIEMAKAELTNGDDPELKKLAQAIIDAQQREIDEMNGFREKTYGEESPEAMRQSAQ